MKLNVEALVMSERIETVVPAIYMICVLMGWFGPNGTILGNIKLTIWHYAAIEDFQAFLQLSWHFLSDTCGRPWQSSQGGSENRK